MSITAAKYYAGMSEKLDCILSKGEIKKAWVVRNNQDAVEVILADTAAEAVSRYAAILKMKKR